MTAHFVTRWTIVSVVAETAAVALAFFTLAASWNAILTVAVVEALLLGVGQRWVLRERRPGLERGWILATVAGTLLGRAFEYVADTSGFGAVVATWTVAAQVAMGIVAGAAVGALMAVPQAFLLRGRIERPWLWIAARAAAWGCALPASFFAGFVTSRYSGANVANVAALVLGSFALIAAFVGVVEGFTLERLTSKVSTQPKLGTPQAEVGNGRALPERRRADVRRARGCGQRFHAPRAVQQAPDLAEAAAGRVS